MVLITATEVAWLNALNVVLGLGTAGPLVVVVGSLIRELAERHRG